MPTGIEKLLEETLGLRECNLFKNIVLFAPMTIPHNFSANHNFDLNVLFRELEIIRDIIVRHSERADLWRIRGLELGSG